MKLGTLARMYLDYWRNAAAAAGKKPYSVLYYIVEPAEWSTKWDGEYITKNLNNQNLISARTTTIHRGIRNQIIHFGSRNLFLPDTWRKIDASNKIVFTWFHGTEKSGDPLDLAMIQALPQASEKADIIHTSCVISRENLINWGVLEDKIVVVPIGVDLSIFKPASEAAKGAIRKELGLPQDSFIIGSFQKDGVGWGERLEPKWVKGPDIFVSVIERLKKEHKISVLLTGPARGYVKKALERIGVPYKHFFLKNYLEIPKYYYALDIYLVTSRAEGGPKALTESMAAGIPLVSTKVGMAPDIIEDGFNGLLADVDDVAVLAAKAAEIIADRELAGRLISNGLTTVGKYSWQEIARQYYEGIYKPLLGKVTK